MVDLLTIPRIVDCVARRLDHPTLACCLRVSKRWHLAFVPYLWHTFGLLPPCTLRFGIARPPEGFWGVDFPIKVSESHLHQDSSTSTPVLALARDEIYPEGYFALGVGILDKRQWSMWRRLFTRNAFSTDEAMAMQAVVAKYAPYIQRLAVRSLDAFYIFQPLCRNLEAFYFRLDSYDLESVFDNAQMEQRLMEAKPSIVKFILDQPYLRSLHLSRVLMPPAELRDWILVKRPFWRHADVVLSETEYPHITSLLPVVQSCRFRIPSSSCLWTPLAEPHHHMRELDLQILGDSHYVLLWFNRVALTGIAKSFPNLRRLVIRDARGLVRLDLMMEGCTRLTIYRLPLSENNHYQKLAVRQLASILSMLPRVVALHIDRWFDEDFETVVLFCPHLMYAYASRKLDLEVITSRPSTTTTTTTTVTLPFNLPPVPPPTVQLLLAHCPDLRRVEMLDYELHLRHLARERWVCHHLQSLGCHLTGVSPVTKPTKINFPHSNAATRP